MTEETKVLKDARISDKTIKETSAGKKYFSFGVQARNEQYPKVFSWFPNTPEDAAVADSFSKGDSVDLLYFVKEQDHEGKQVTYRNIKHMIKTEKVPEESTPQEEWKELINKALATKQIWIEHFLNDPELEDIPKEHLVSIFSTLFIQACRSIK
jgi:rubrerythrin